MFPRTKAAAPVHICLSRPLRVICVCLLCVGPVIQHAHHHDLAVAFHDDDDESFYTIYYYISNIIFHRLLMLCTKMFNGIHQQLKSELEKTMLCLPVDRILITFVYLGHRTHHMVGNRRYMAGRPVAAARTGMIAVHADGGRGRRMAHVR